MTAGPAPDPGAPDPDGSVIHASAVALDGRGIVILGPSGAGKSALALQLMALGAVLIADDRVLLTLRGGRLHAAAPPGLPPLIEARGIGLLRAPLHAGAVAVSLAVDLARTEDSRLPPWRSVSLLGQPIALVHGPVSGHFPAAIRHYVLHGRQD